MASASRRARGMEWRAKRCRRLMVEQFEPRIVLANLAPNGADATITALEDTPYVFQASDFGFSDTDSPPSSFFAVKIVSLPGQGALTNGSKLLAAGTFVYETEIAKGNLRFVPFPSMSGSAYASFAFHVQDNNGVANGVVDPDPPNTILINVLPVNDAPAGMDQTVAYIFGGNCRGVTLKPANFSLTDLADFPENGLAGVKITTLPGAGVLSDNNVAVVGGQVVPIAVAAGGLLRYQPQNCGSGFTISDTFTFQVQDDGGTANGGVDLDPVARTMKLNGIQAIGNPPMPASDITVAIREDATYTFSPVDFDFTDPRDGNSVTSVTIGSEPFQGSLRLNGALSVPVGTTIQQASLNQLQFVPYANENGSPLTQFTVQVQDTASSFNFTHYVGINVSSVNDAPQSNSNTVTAVEDTTYTVGLNDFGFTDYYDNPANNFYTVRIVTAPVAGLLTCGGVPVKAGDIVLTADVLAGKLRFTPAANVSGAGYANFAFQVQDDGGAANLGSDTSFWASTLAIDVASVNDAPSGSNRTVVLRAGNVITGGFFGFQDSNDTPANKLKAVKIVTVPTTGTLTINGVAVAADQFVTADDILQNRLLYAAPTNGDNSTYATITFQVQDDGGTSNGGIDLDPMPKTLNVIFNSSLGHNPVNPADLDGNTVVDPTDVIMMINFLHAHGPVTAVGPSMSLFWDVNADGWVTYADLSSLMDVFAPGNRPPMSNAKTVTTPVNVPYVFQLSDFAFNDEFDFPQNNFQSVEVKTLPSQGILVDQGTVVIGQLVPVADIIAGDFQYLPGNSASNSGSDSFDFVVHDDGGPLAKGIGVGFYTFTINFAAAINMPPSFKVGAVQSVGDLDGPQAVRGWATKIFPGPPDEAGQNVHFEVSNDDAGLFAVQPAVDANGKLTYEPKVGASGRAVVSVVAVDDGGTAVGGVDRSPLQTFTIDVSRSFPWHNRGMAADVDGDGQVVAGDVVDVINFINAKGSAQVAKVTGTGNPPITQFYDVTGDDYIAADDVVTIINYINAHPDDKAPEAEASEEQGPSATSPTLGASLQPADDLLLLLAADAALATRRRM